MGPGSDAWLLFTSNFPVLWLCILTSLGLGHTNGVWTKFQGHRMQTVGVVDAEYITHLALPTLGTSDGKKASITGNLLF